MEALDLHHVVPHAHLGGALALDKLFDFPAVFANQHSQRLPSDLRVRLALPLDQIDRIEAVEQVTLLQWYRNLPISVLPLSVAFPRGQLDLFNDMQDLLFRQVRVVCHLFLCFFRE